MQSRQVSNFKINKMTKAQYSGIVPSQDEVYITTDEADAVLSVNGVLPNAQGNVTLNIPSAVTESTVSGWGFTKNVGTVTSVNGNTPDGSGNVAITIPDISNLADKDLSNLSSTGKKVIDGQWVKSTIALVNSGSFSADTDTAYDLSTYLPDDNYKYEVLGSLYGSTLATSGKYVNMYVKSSECGSLTVASTITRTSSSMRFGGLFIMPIGTNRTITFKDTGDGGTGLEIVIQAYRRIGTNQ